ncbi:hypothetical protein [uncultured Gimesia sp.]|uniref:hypothetical protein n=1 Tax=uncultured Gimesia sp. TaxID=1678688 RepID=UPI0030DBA715|tara:strand:+ start:90003 stop:90452 length:450 start_codon:yes stop_codon:yes gene_type:complete
MFEFEDHNFLEAQLLKAAADPGISLRVGHRQQVLDAARQTRSRRVCRRSLAALGTFFLAVGLCFLTRDSKQTPTEAADSAPGWSKTIYVKGSQVLGISTPARRPEVIKTDWNSVQATLKQSGEWGLVEAVVRFRNERAGTIEQIFDRGD